MSLTGNVKIRSSGTLDVSTNSYGVTLSGGWLSSGSFTKRSGTVTLDGNDQSLSGTTVFHNLTKTVTTAQILTFSVSGVQSISGALTLQGASGNRLSIRSERAGTAGRIFLDGSSGTQTIDNLDVKDSNASGGQALVCLLATENCVNSGNNTNWWFYSLTGTVYGDEGITPLANKRVSVSINGASVADSAVSDSNGTYALSGFTLTGGTIIALYIDNESEDAVTVSMGSGSSMTGLNLFASRLIVRAYTGGTTGTINTHNLRIAAQNGDSDIAAVFIVDGASTLNLAANREFFIATESEFQAGGTVNAGSGVDINGRLVMGSSALTMSGSFDATGGTYSLGSSTVTFDGTETDMLIASNGGEFSAVTFGAAGTWTLSGAMTASGTLTLSDGTLNSSTLSAKGNVTQGTGFDGGTTALSIDGTGNQTLTGGGSTSAGSFLTMTVDKSAGTLTMSSILRTARNVLHARGAVSTGSSTGAIAGSITLESPGVFNSIDIVSGTATLSGGLALAGNVKIRSSGTLDVSTSSFPVTFSGGWLNSGSFTKRSGLVTLDGADQSVSGTTLFHNFTKTTGIARTLTFSTSGVQSVSGTLILRGTGGNLLSIRSSFSGAYARLLLDGNAGIQIINNLDVKDSNAAGGQRLICLIYTEGWVDSGHNINWRFETDKITGTLYRDEGVHTLSGRIVSYSVSGASIIDNTLTDQGGQFTVSGAFVRAGTPFTIFVNDGTLTCALVGVSSGSNMTGMHLFKDRLIVHNATGGVVTGLHLAVADGSNEPNLLAVYREHGNTVWVNPGRELLVWSGSTLTATGAIRAGSGVDINGTMVLGSHQLTMSGSLEANGVLSSTGLIVFNGSSTGNTILTDDNVLYSVTFSGSGLWTLADDLHTSNILTIQSGSTLAMGESFLIPRSTTIFKKGGLFIPSVNPERRIIFNGTLTLEDEEKHNLGIVQFGSGSHTVTLSGHILTTDLIVAENSTFRPNGYNVSAEGTITNIGTFNATDGAQASSITLSGSFLNYSTLFTAGNSQVTLNGSNQRIIGSTTFANLEKVHTGGDTLRFGNGNTFIVTGTLALQGTGSALLRLRSTAQGGCWTLNPGTNYTIDAVSVQDGRNIGRLYVNPSNSSNAGHNARWFVGDPGEIDCDNDTSQPEGSGLGGDDYGETGYVSTTDGSAIVVIPIIVVTEEGEEEPPEGTEETSEETTRPPRRPAVPEEELRRPPRRTASDYMARRIKVLDRMFARIKNPLGGEEVVDLPPRTVVVPEEKGPAHGGAPLNAFQRFVLNILTELFNPHIPFGPQKLVAQAGTQLTAGLAVTP